MSYKLVSIRSTEHVTIHPAQNRETLYLEAMYRQNLGLSPNNYGQEFSEFAFREQLSCFQTYCHAHTRAAFQDSLQNSIRLSQDPGLLKTLLPQLAPGNPDSVLVRELNINTHTLGALIYGTEAGWTVILPNPGEREGAAIIATDNEAATAQVNEFHFTDIQVLTALLEQTYESTAEAYAMFRQNAFGESVLPLQQKEQILGNCPLSSLQYSLELAALIAMKTVVPPTIRLPVAPASDKGENTEPTALAPQLSPFKLLLDNQRFKWFLNDRLICRLPSLTDLENMAESNKLFRKRFAQTEDIHSAIEEAFGKTKNPFEKMDIKSVQVLMELVENDHSEFEVQYPCQWKTLSQFSAIKDSYAVSTYPIFSHQQIGETLQNLGRDFPFAFKALCCELASEVSGRAHKLALDKREKEALACYELLRVLDPSDLDSLHIYQKMLVNMGEFNEAVEVNKSILEVDAGNTRALMQLLHIFEKCERYEEAVRICTRLIGENRYNPSFYIKRSEYYHKLELHEPARKDEEFSLKIPFIKQKMVYIKGFMDTGSYAMAQGLLGKLEEADPDNPDWCTIRARIFQAEERFDEGIEVLSNALKKYPDQWIFRYYLGSFCLMSGRMAEARPYLEQVLKIKKDHAPSQTLLAGLLQENGELEEAKQYWEMANAWNPKQPDILLQLSRVCIDNNEFDDALPYLKLLAKLTPFDYTARLLTAVCRKALGDIAGAREELNVITSSFTADEATRGEAYYFRGLILKEEKDYEGAIAEFNQARLLLTDAEPQTMLLTDVPYQKAICHYRLEQLSEAEQEFDTLLSVCDDEGTLANIYYYLGRIQYDWHPYFEDAATHAELHKAEKYLSDSLALFPENPKALKLRAAIYRKLGNFTAANQDSTKVNWLELTLDEKLAMLDASNAMTLLRIKGALPL